MRKLRSVLRGLSLVTLISLSGYVGWNKWNAEYSARAKLENFKTITGFVEAENFISNLLSSEYQVAIKTPEQRKIVVLYTSNVSGNQPEALNTLFSKGDKVDLDVATNEEFEGYQKFVGLGGRLSEEGWPHLAFRIKEGYSN
ncbi:MAG: hypothetical protein AABW46_02970 [Nanoarchaeota archaeon]